MLIKRALLAAMVCGSLVGLTSGLVGCKDPTPAGTVAGSGSNAPVGTVDLLKVFNALNYTSFIDSKVATYRVNLQAQLKSIGERYNQEIQEYLKSVSPNAKPNDKITLTQEQAQRLNQLGTVAQNALRELDQKGGQVINDYRSEYIRQYRVALGQISRKVAQDKKVSIILAVAENVIYSDPALDFTNAVVDETNAHPFTPTEVQMQTIPAPPKLVDLISAPPATQPSGTPPTGSAPATAPKPN